jgi:hypothetical protein
MKTTFNHPFFTKSWTAGFLSNVLGVIVGIALTLGVGHLIQRRSEKKEIHTLMTLIKKEITANKTTLANMRTDFMQTREAYGLLLSSTWKTLPEDSIRPHVSKAQNITSYTLQNTAWNVFQNSNVVRSFEDKELIMELSEWYLSIEEAYKWWERYSNEKMEAMIFRANDAPDIPVYIDSVVNNERSRRFLEDMSLYHKYTFDEPLANRIERADAVLRRLDPKNK